MGAGFSAFREFRPFREGVGIWRKERKARLLDGHAHGVKFSPVRVEDQPATFKCGCSEEGFVTFFAEDNRGKATLSGVFKICTANMARYFCSISEKEFHRFMGSDDHFFQFNFWNQAV